MDSDHGGTAGERLEIETARAGLDVLRKRVTIPQDTPARKRVMAQPKVLNLAPEISALENPGARWFAEDGCQI
jgi:hypothetical protein